MPARRMRKMRKGKKSGLAKARAANKDVHSFVLKTQTVLVPVQGALVSNYMNVFLSPAPGDGANAQTCALKLSTEFALYKQMFDQFRVKSVSIKVVPKITQVDASALLTSGVTVGRGVYYTVIDRDGPVPSSISAIKKYASSKTHPMTKSARRTYRISYDGKDQWFDCQNPNAIEDVQKSLGLWGGISVYGESFPEVGNTVTNDSWGDLEVEYSLVFRGKALVGITPNLDGSVTLAQPDLETLDPVTVFQATDGINLHLGSIDLSGNPINVDVA